MRLYVKARVYPTEDKEKVKIAILNLFENVEVEEVYENGELYIVARGKKRECLSKMREAIRRQAILDTVRSVLMASIEDNKRIRVKLNKQAAFAGSLNFYEDSILGYIEVVIEAENIYEIIDWLAPSTVD